MPLRLNSPLVSAVALVLVIALALTMDRFVGAAAAALAWTLVAIMLLGAVPRELYGSDQEESSELLIARYYA
jgi:hypothetical protein